MTKLLDKNMKPSQILFKKNLKSCTEFKKIDPTQALVVYDRKLERYPFFKTWLKKFKFSYSVNAGEKLKTIQQYEKLCNYCSKNLTSVDRKNFVVVACGGGSVGDFVGFFASTFKRGVKLWHLPTTWLAAIDSAHGGKTALNVASSKNQIGTFYFAEKVIICEEFFKELSSQHFFEGLAEIIKIGLVYSKPFLVEKKYFEKTLTSFPVAILRKSIQAKWAIVKKDPFELNNVRFILNFGHSFGHAIEVLASISHGQAVANGMEMALKLSHYFGYLSAIQYQSLMQHYRFYFFQQSLWQKMKFKTDQLQRHLLKDKKASTNQRIHFVFLRGTGKPLVKKVLVSELVTAALAVSK